MLIIEELNRMTPDSIIRIQLTAPYQSVVRDVNDVPESIRDLLLEDIPHDYGLYLPL